MDDEIKVHTLPPEFLPQIAKKKNYLWLIVAAAVVLVVGGGVGAYFYLVRKNVPPPTVSTVPVPPPPPPAPLIPEPAPPAPTSTPPVPELPLPTPPVLQAAPDSDGDGLTDDEEVIYKTDPHNPDTDADNFIDGNEVFKLYSPIAPGSAQLVDSGLVKVFTNDKQKYSIFYPTPFGLDIIDATSTTEVAFTAAAGERFIVTVIPNNNNLSPLNYYLAAHPEVPITAISSATSRGGFSGITSPDGLETILDGKNNFLYSFTYDVGNNSLKRFTTTYHMMINSFKLLSK